MNDVSIAHEFRGDLHRDGEADADLLVRIRAHLRDVFPRMSAAYRWNRSLGSNGLMVSITEYPSADLSQREAGSAARRLVDAELKRFTRHDWDPLRGIVNPSLSVNTRIDPSLHTAALDDAPALEPTLSFAEFTRRARAGDILEHLEGVQPPQGTRVEIVAVSSRRLTTCAVGGTGDARPARVPIQGGACFASDGDRVCFRHSGFASQGGYSLLRWTQAVSEAA